MFVIIGSCYADDDPIIHFPDPWFKNFIMYSYADYIDKNEDGEIQKSEAKLLDSKMEMLINDGAITDLSGIEYFTNIGKIRINGLVLDTLDISGMSVLWLLNASFGTQINNLIAEDCTGLKYISMYDCNVENFNIGNCTSLKKLEVENNKITYIDISDSPNIEEFSCWRNNISNIKFPNTSQLFRFSADINDLTDLDLSNQENLSLVYIGQNSLLSLNLQNSNNKLIEKLVLSENPDLECVEVDDVTWCNANWYSNLDDFQLDSWTKLSEDCSNSVTDINELGFEFFPNPAEEVVNIQHTFPLHSDLRIIDMKGRIYLSHTLPLGQKEYSLDISSLTSGTYLIEINNQSSKLIKK